MKSQPSPPSRRKRDLLRDLFLGALALIMLYDQVFIAPHAQAILIFTALFLLGSIPALRGDDQKHRYGPFARLVMMALGIPFPTDFQELEEDGIPSGSGSQTSSDGRRSASDAESSSKSSTSK